MDKSKIIPIILLVIVLVVGYVAFTFFQENEVLKQTNSKLENDKNQLNANLNSLQSRYNQLKSDRDSLARRAEQIEAELSRLQGEKQSLQARYDKIAREKEALVEQLAARKQNVVEVRDTREDLPTGTSEQYWMDFVRKKADLESQVSLLNNQLLEAKNRLAGLNKDNKELSIRIDELTKAKETLEREIAFKERAMSIMSKDLVSEREARRKLSQDLEKMRADNVGLKRELVITNKEKMQLQDNLKDTVQSKEVLARKVSEIRSILKEKSIALEELEEQLNRAIKGGSSAIVTSEAVSVELPPIVVKPAAAGISGLRGEVVAVNAEERFVIVDIGESQGVRPGYQFSVMRGDRPIGIIEVVETRKEISAADVKELFSGFVVKEGDIIISR